MCPVSRDRSRSRTIAPVRTGSFGRVARGAGFTAFVILFLIGFFLLVRGLSALRTEGLKYFTNSGFDTLHKPYHFGAAAQMYGTIVISIIAVIVGVPLAIGTALFMTDYAPLQTRRALFAMVDLGAAVPSIIFASGPCTSSSPQITGTNTWIVHHLSFIPIFTASNTAVQRLVLRRRSDRRPHDRADRRLGLP